MRTTKIALLHLAPVPGAIDRNQATLETAIRSAAAAGARWVITPELVTCGLQFARIIGTDWIQPQPDAWMTGLCRLVKALKITLFLGCPEADDGKRYNSVFVIGPDGEIIGRCRKINVASDSRSWSSPGEKAALVQCDGIPVGILVCADAYSPGIASELKAQGAQLLISPASWGPGLHGPNGEWEERTQDTGLPLIVCNRTGHEQTMGFQQAQSLVVKDGRHLWSHSSEHPAILVLDWSFATMAPRAGFANSRESRKFTNVLPVDLIS